MLDGQDALNFVEDCDKSVNSWPLSLLDTLADDLAWDNAAKRATAVLQPAISSGAMARACLKVLDKIETTMIESNCRFPVRTSATPWICFPQMVKAPLKCKIRASCRGILSPQVCTDKSVTRCTFCQEGALPSPPGCSHVGENLSSLTLVLR